MLIHPAYLAGFFDGEGSIGIRKQTCKTTRRGFRYQIYASASNNWKPVLEEIQSEYGGYIYCSKSFHSGLNIKRLHDNYSLVICSRDAEKILRAMSEYLKIKKPQCSLALEMCANSKYRGTALSDEEWDLREHQFQLMRKMNDRHNRAY